MNTTITVRSARRLIATSLLATLAALASASPTLAGGATLWVDDDGRAGPTSCGSTHVADTSVQDAIDASSQHATILVCPGTYQEALRIDASHDGLTIRSARVTRAQILTPTDASSLIKVLHVEDVSIERLDLRTRPEPPCASIKAMVTVQKEAQGIALRELSITPGGTETSGGCGFERGIKAQGASSMEVTDSTIRDFERGGIALAGAGTSGTLLRNTILFIHESLAWTGSNEGGHGITTVNEAHVVIRNNRIEAGPNAGPGGTRDLNTGISIAGLEVIATDNQIRHVRYGMVVYSDGATIRRSDMQDGFSGFLFAGADDAVLTANRVQGYEYGTHVGDPSAGNLFQGNDFRGNFTFDCWDISNGTGTAGTANTWIDNIGLTDDKDGICSPPAP